MNTPENKNKKATLAIYPRARAIRATDTGIWYIFATEIPSTPIIGEGKSEPAAWVYSAKTASLAADLPYGPVPDPEPGCLDWRRAVGHIVDKARKLELQPNYADKNEKHGERIEAYYLGVAWVGYVVRMNDDVIVGRLWGRTKEHMFNAPGILSWKPL